MDEKEELMKMRVVSLFANIGVAEAYLEQIGVRVVVNEFADSMVRTGLKV